MIFLGKTAACIKIIQLLSCRDVVSTNELADLLETNPRNIKEYIKEIQLLGYNIESYKGKYGGYKLDRREILPSVSLTDDEKNSIQKGVDFLKESNDFLIYDQFQAAMGKIMASFNSSSAIVPLSMIDRFPLAIDKNVLAHYYQVFSDAIISQLKCEVTYIPASNVPKVHILHPYKLFSYNGSWFVLAWNEKINDFGYYKLNRIERIELTRNHFTILKTFDESKYLDEFGMKQNGDYYKIHLELRDLNTVIQERIYGKNQEVEIIDSHTSRLKCEMQNKNMILSFVLSFGSKCKVLEPKWLILAVNDEAKKILNN